MTETTATEKTRISPKTETMVKTKDGSFHKDDFVGSTLAGLNIDQVKAIAAELGIEANKYDHLNVGQQRMNIGNRLRALTAHKDGMKEEAAAKIDENRDTADRMATAFRETNAAAAEVAAKEAEAAKEAKAAAKAAAKPAKGVKDPDPVDGEGDTPD